jgi:hypothetical protein
LKFYYSGTQSFNSSGTIITNNARCARGIQSGIAMTKAAFSKKKNPLSSKLDLNFRKQLAKCYITVLKLGNFGKYITNTRKMLKCGAGEG